MVGEIIGGFGDLIAGIGGINVGKEANQIEKDNLTFQKDLLEYQKGIQQTIFDREDNATQRKVEDLKAAGLSPVLAAGQGARAGAVVGMKAPQRGVASMAMRLQGIDRLASVGRTITELANIEAQTKRISAESELIKANTGRVIQLTDHEKDMLKAQLQKIYNENTEFAAFYKHRLNILESEEDIKKFEASIKFDEKYWAQVESEAKAIDQAYIKWFKNTLNEQLKGRYKEGDADLARLNPYVIDLIAKETAIKAARQGLEIEGYNYKWYKDKELPVGSSSVTSLGATLGSRFAEWLEDEWRGIRGR